MNQSPDEGPDRKQSPDEWLSRRFQDVRPVGKPPALYTINGIGTRFSGRRDHDAGTGSHVTTRVFSFLFIPLIALDAWRIIPVSGGRYQLLGKVPLSGFAKGARWLVLGVVALLGGVMAWHSHTHSPGYLAKNMLETAEADLRAGQPAVAMNHYLTILNNDWPQADEARKGYESAFEAALRTGNAAERVLVVQAGRWAMISGHHLLEDEGRRVMAWAEEEKDAGMVVKVMKAALPAVRETDHAAYEALRRRLLEKVTAETPDNADAAIDLAFILDAEDRGDDARKLLEPLKDKLGSSEGARILGRLLVHEGDYQGGAALLDAYAPERIKAYLKAEADLERIYKRVSEGAVDTLDKNQGPRSFYSAYERSDENEKKQLVSDYVVEQLKKSTALSKAQETLAQAAGIVPVMLDLGIATLHLAQEERDAGQRRARLEQAEKAFLSIRQAAGESDEYRLFLGQVYYWLGKQKDGKALFDELLAGTRDTELQLMVVESLRQVGEKAEARRVAEDCYAKGATREERNRAAQTRGLLWTDIDDRILWLERQEASEYREIELSDARANKLIQEGRSADAIPLLRKVIAGYENQPRSASSLNNSANVLSTLYGITHDPADARESLNRYEEATRLIPEDTVLLGNLAAGYQNRIVLDSAGQIGDLKSLPPGIPGLLLAMTIRTDEDAARQRRERAESEPFRKAVQTLEKLKVLAPREGSHFRALQGLWMSCRNTDQLKALLASVRESAPDHTSEWAMAAQAWEKDTDADALRYIDGAIKEASAALAALPKEARREVKAALLGLIALQKSQRALLAGDIPADQLAGDAEALLKASDSQGARSLAQAVLLEAAIVDGRKDAEFAAFVDKYRRILGVNTILSTALEKNIGGEALRKNPRLLRWAALIRQDSETFPDAHGLNNWALLRQIDPGQAEAMGRTILADECLLTDLELDVLLTPWSVSTVITESCLRQLKGEPRGDSGLWQEAVKKGMPLPPL